MTWLRTLLQNLIAFPLHSLFAPAQIKGRENLENIRLPGIFYFNHIGNMDGVCVLRALPRSIRERLVIATDVQHWGGNYRKFFVVVFGAGFPFDKREKIKASLELTGEFLDKGYSVLITPEGDYSPPSGKLMQFKPGTGFLAVEMQVPVVPIKISSAYREIFPPEGKSFWDNFPKKRKEIAVTIGKPLSFPKNTPFEEATEKMRKALQRL